MAAAARVWKAPQLPERGRFQWERGDAIAMAKQSCTTCHGLGLYLVQEDRWGPCACVLRAIFRACLARYRHIQSKEKHMSRPSMEVVRGRERNFSWGRRDEEYCADFWLVSKRNLSEWEWRLFQLHFIAGLEWRLCVKQLDCDRGTFFHAVYRIEKRLGRVFRELKPYALFPLQDYFSSGRTVNVMPLAVEHPGMYSRDGRVRVESIDRQFRGYRKGWVMFREEAR